MATLPVKNNTTPASNMYGAGPFFELNETLLGAGAAAPPVPLVTGASPPCAMEIVKVVRNSAGNYTLTFADEYFAIAGWNVNLDDINGATPWIAALGQWSNLGAGGPGTPGQPLTCVLTTYSAGGAATDAALNTPIRITIIFKKESTGAAV